MSRPNFWAQFPMNLFAGRKVIPAGLLVLTVLLAYFPAWHGGFVWDDSLWTTDLLPLFQNAGGLKSIWFQPTVLQQYYPLAATTFWLDYQFWQFWTLPYHLENILLHAFAALLFWRLLLRLQLPGAGLAAALFALHPVMVESAAWITERKNVLSLVLYLAALLAYEHAAPRTTPAPGPLPEPARRPGRTAGFYGLAFVLFLGALLAKTTAFSLPAVILLLAWWRRGRLHWRTDVLPTLPFFALAAALCALTAWLEKNHVGAQGQDFAQSFPQRCLIAGRAFWFYLGSLFWPANLCAVYPRWQVNPGVWWQWLYPITALGTLSALWLARKRIGRGPLTALLFFVGSLFPVLGFMDTYYMRYSFVCDRWVYLSSLGIIALVAALVVRAAEQLRRPALVGGFAILVLPVLAGLTWRQAGTFKDMETLWQTTLAKNPDCWVAHSNLGVVLLAAGDKAAAVEHYRKAIQINPNFYEALNDLGIILAQDGQLDEAMTDYDNSIRINPDYAEAWNNLGVALATKGQVDDAIKDYYRAIQADPAYFQAWNNLGRILVNKNRFDEAIQSYYRAVQLKPDYYKALHNLGVALNNQGRYQEAIGSLQRAIQINPDDADDHLNLAMALSRSDRASEAAAEYREALRLNPDLITALNNLAWILSANSDDRVRNGPEAVTLAERACDMTHYQQPLFIGTLAAAYAEAGRFPEAVATAHKAEQLATSAGLAKVAERNRQLLELYQAGKPFHESSPP